MSTLRILPTTQSKRFWRVNGSIPDSPTINTLGSGFSFPWGVTVDDSGNVYVADTSNNAIKEILAVNGSIPASPTIKTLGSGFQLPRGIAVDAVGNVYVGDTLNGVVKEILAVNGTIPALPTINILASGGAAGLALDSNGNLYVANGSYAVSEILAVNGSIPSSPTVKLLYGGSYYGGDLYTPRGVAVDATGSVYIADSENYRVLKETPPGANLAAVNIGTKSPAVALSFVFTSPGQIGSVAALTQGATTLDFADAGTGNCDLAGYNWAAGNICLLDVTFTPRAAGTRIGTAALYDSSGNVLATAQLQGTGVGPQINFLPGTQSTLGSGFSSPWGVAVDGAANIYVGDTNNNAVKEILAVNGSIPPSPSILTLGSGFSLPKGVAIDGAGNVYVADTGHNAVKEIVAAKGGIPASPIIRTLGSFDGPEGVAVDARGNVYTTQPFKNEVDEIQAVNGVIPPSPVIVSLGSGFNLPVGVAVDAAGDVYVADTGNSSVKEILALNGAIPASPTINIIGSGFVNPTGLALDGSGNLLVSDFGANRLQEIWAVNGSIPASPLILTLATGLNTPFAVAVDGSVNAYVADTSNDRILKLDLSDPPSLVFAPTPIGSTSIESPQNVGLVNIGNASLIFPIPSTGNNPSIAANFTLNSSGGGVCPLVSSGSFQPAVLTPGASCVLPISFAPGAAGAFSGSLVLTDNNLNAAAPGYATQTISLSGTGVQVTPVITWNTPHGIFYGTALSAEQLNATANVPGTFSYSPAAGTILPVGTDTLTVTFTPTDTTAYTTATASVTLSVHVASPAITWNTPAPITYGTALGAAQLNASSPVSGTFLYTPAAGTVLSAGQQTLTVKFTPTDSGDYSTAFGSVLLTVNKATPVITWPTPAPIAYPTPLSSTQLDASANVPGTFAYNPAAGGVALPVGTNTLTTVFTPADTQDYATATASVLLTVTPNFTLSASSASLAIVQNNSATSTISVIPYGGFTGNVQLSVSGLPNGVTASFGTNPTTATSVLTYKVGPKANIGTSYVTVSGSSGSLTRTTTIALRIDSRK
jgi:sugar lactone lactonase YvrE